MNLDEIRALEPATEEGEKLRGEMLAAAQKIQEMGFGGDDFTVSMTPQLRELIEGRA
jgi:hypothetical protein